MLKCHGLGGWQGLGIPGAIFSRPVAVPGVVGERGHDLPPVFVVMPWRRLMSATKSTGFWELWPA